MSTWTWADPDAAWFAFDIGLLAVVVLSGVFFSAFYDEGLDNRRSGPALLFASVFFPSLVVLAFRVLYLLVSWGAPWL